ncbi:hypothetical protein A1O1_00831 [Capronia coronata CBS 617.96]|uniref:Uncharacterized protein n=1 Tax=Capronia coronata CBS 617.96 TaxID=1182541 RepID=W9YT32_9EURO|nr:uncharacterized protein A1O1_00831 [Capronia coronata CBS 617.96]EXJ95708.1 hypothetical protein A1O1_00831 [Capronia coronata CBS 617.96]
MQTLPPLTSLFSTALVLLPQLVSATCYWQNSTLAPDDPYSIAPDDTACFPDQENSPCCGTGWTCLSDGVCYIEQGDSSFYYRGTCTDRTWDSQQCPGWCFAQNSTDSIPLIKCDSAQDWYCCPEDPNCDCNSGKDAVKLGDDQPSTVTVIGSTSWPGFTGTTAPFTASPLVSEGTTTDTNTASATEAAQTTTGSDATTTATATATATGSSNGTGVNTAAGAATTSSDNGDGDSDGGGGGGSNTGLAAGLGAGLGAAAVLIGVLAFFLIRARRRRHAVNANSGGPAYEEVPNRSHMDQKASYASPRPTTYQDEQYMVGGTHSKPELPGAGEYNRPEMPASSSNEGGRQAHGSRAELDAS